MAKCVLCEIYDEVAGQYSAPMAFANEASAIRYVKIKSNDPIIKDLKMYKTAEFDSDTGKILVLDEPQLLIRGDQLTNEQTNA